jgi:hypothetical protein
MTRHFLVPGDLVGSRACFPSYVDYLRRWREEAVASAADGDTASSVCLQATLIDLATAGRLTHDWLGVMDEHLTDGAAPLAYSQRFGQRLYGFEGQYRQSTVHAIHTRWWIECLARPSGVDHARFAAMILAKKNTDGLIYDFDVSPTILRHRMKSELTMSAAMASEILAAAAVLTEKLSLEMATQITEPSKCPPLGYMGMEYFRLHALRLLGHVELFPAGIEGHISACAVGLPVGWADFAMSSKRDAYMGTTKRTQRDKPIHSPMTALHVVSLARGVLSSEVRAPVDARFSDYALHLSKYPRNIPAFQMRDVPIPFGCDITPLEAICASNVIAANPGK